MSYATINEKCSCGATFVVTWDYRAESAAKTWRETHVHEMREAAEPASPMPLTIEPISTVQLVAWMTGKTPQEVEQVLADALDKALTTD